MGESPDGVANIAQEQAQDVVVPDPLPILFAYQRGSRIARSNASIRTASGACAVRTWST
jgi:hypothetical protein